MFMLAFIPLVFAIIPLILMSEDKQSHDQIFVLNEQYRLEQAKLLSQHSNADIEEVQESIAA